jgi:hypothetical protein
MKRRMAAITAAVVLGGALVWLVTKPAQMGRPEEHRPVTEPPKGGERRGGAPPVAGRSPEASAPSLKREPPIPAGREAANPPAATVPSIKPVAPAPMVSRTGGGAPQTGAANSPPAPELSEIVARDIDRLSLMFRDFRTRMGENPVGTNAEIMKAVMGGNPKGAMLGPPEGQFLNGQGEIVDHWGTPYFFHQLSGTHMQIRSAGPDRVMWTADDIVSP